jgi:hypothetical protein
VLHVQTTFNGEKKRVDMVKPNAMSYDELVDRLKTSRTREPLGNLSRAVNAQLGPFCLLSDSVHTTLRRTVQPANTSCEDTAEAGVELAKWVLALPADEHPVFPGSEKQPWYRAPRCAYMFLIARLRRLLVAQRR